MAKEPLNANEVVLAEEAGHVSILTLNRPRQLNVISSRVVELVAKYLEKWERDDDIKLVIIKGAGRAFSAGGDLKMFYEGRSGDFCLEVVYRMYWLCYHIHTYTKTMVAIVHGIVMGGGAAMTVPSKFSVVTEKTVFSMPEASIGLHTDCSFSYILPRLPGYLGEYLGLTDAKLYGKDMVALGLATHFVESEKLDELEKRLLSLNSGDESSVRNVIEEFSIDVLPEEATILNRLQTINKCFCKESLEEIIESFEAEARDDGNEWIWPVLKGFKRSSPTGLKITLRSGVSSTFTVRGKNLLSRCEDDNFVVDDDLTPSFEVPFLNLDLHALAAQLSKLKLSERLFIEADILPEDLRSEDSKDISSSLQSETLGSINVAQDLDSLPHSSPAKDSILKNEDENLNVFPYSNLSQIHSDQGNVGGTGRDAQKSPGNMNEISPLKVGEAEAELDLLLESFRETNLSGSIQDRPLRKTPPSEISFPNSTRTNRNAGLMNRNQTIEAELDSLLDPIQGSPADRISNLIPQNPNFYQNSSIQDRVFSKNAAAASIDDSIDVLLSETSLMPNMLMPNMQKNAIAADQPLGADRPRLFSGSGSIDDVRADASVKGRFSDLGSGDVIDDFDSWMDTL